MTTTTTTTTTVRAWTYKEPGYPQTLRQSSLPAPDISTPESPTHIVVQVHAASLNPVDIQLMNLPAPAPAAGSDHVEKILSKDFSGRVLAAGSQTGFAVGDEVMGLNMGMTGTGFLAEIVSLDLKKPLSSPAGGAGVIKKPTQLDWVQAASLPVVWQTARVCIASVLPWMKKPANQAKLVVLGGSSATGIYTIQQAKRRGWTVLTSCSGRNVDFVQNTLGADQVVDYTTSPNAVVDAVKNFRPDAIVDCVGGTETIGLARRYVTIVGDKTTRSTMGGPFLYAHMPRMWLRWLWGYIGLGSRYDCVIATSDTEYLREVNDLKPEDVVIDSVFDFGQVKEAYEKLDTARARGKVVVRVKAETS